MTHNSQDPTAEELIVRLDKGNLSKEEMDELVGQMQAKGLSGSIMAVSSEEEGKATQEYIEYHPKVPAMVPKSEIEDIKKSLLDKGSSIEQKKQAIVILAHIGRVDVLEVLEQYEKDPAEELRIWINMATQECESFLKGDILEEPQMSIGRVSKIGRNQPCPCGSRKKFKKCCG